MGKKVELLAPAGNFEAFLGAVNAGADAVYLGGEQFGARAYADNFTAAEILRTLYVAHFYGKKIYLTVNTLLKERELATLFDYLTPFYEAGLDGVIVQDLGVLRYLRERFPGLTLHASTQMTVTGAGGAALLKEAGISRIVPARELSLLEVQKIREEAGVEVECFIHGAMCYCYSGQCLFSSILGGRSGNRGRCAQPCRLPYEIFEGKKRLAGEGYPLSLKDMCTLEYLPALIGVGIDSFKIEGRMKRPEYAAGVTAIYRKYIDRCYGDSARYQVEKADLDRLKRLYIRSEIQTGYYERHNGKEMITLEKPGYENCDEALLGEIREEYIREPEKMPVRIKARVAVDEPLEICISSDWRDDGVKSKADESVFEERQESAAKCICKVESKAAAYAAEVTGETVQPAKKAPLTEEAVRKQLTKMGDSLLRVTECEIEMEGEGFVPVRALNELRREAVAAFEVIVCEKETSQKFGGGSAEDAENRLLAGAEQRSAVSAGDEFRQNMNQDRLSQSTNKDAQSRPIHALVATLDQFRAAVSCGCSRIYIESDLFLRERDEVLAILKNGDEAGIAGSEGTAADEDRSFACYLALPFILRERDEDWLRRFTEALRAPEIRGRIQGFLIRSLEGLAFARDVSEGMEKAGKAYSLVADAGLYCFNGEAAAFLADYVDEITLPYELNAGEAAHLVQAAKRHGLSANLIVYSHIPMMVTANCLAKTVDACRNGAAKGEKAGSRIGEERQIFLKDRKEIAFPVVLNCDHCYNVLYNAVPYSLHTAVKERERIAASADRYDFTIEAGEVCEQILRRTYAFSNYTAGHCKRGVE
ncbi:MAG: U32 family peptidase [Lachnospiraceae bacterium]|nr:U32 family peptidase [Lachnospiraceae bacterium]